MTKEELIRMAREAGLLPHPENIVYQDPMFEGRIKTFAALVAEHERFECAKVCDSLRPSERYMDERYYDAAEDCAAVIRARSNT